jgi:hypothetical protein
VSTTQLWPSILILAGVLAVYYFSVALNGRGLHSFTLELNMSNSRTHS